MILQTVYDMDCNPLFVSVTKRHDYHNEITSYKISFSDDCLEQMKQVVANYTACKKDDWEDDDKHQILRDSFYELLHLVPEEVHWNLEGTIDCGEPEDIADWCESVLEASSAEEVKNGN